jgi:hypothetical protein
MKMQCIRKCFFRDRLWKMGQTAELTDEDIKLDIVKSSFAIPDDAPTPHKATTLADEQPPKDADKDSLSHAELKRRLTAMGVAFRGNASRDVLDKLYQEQVALQSGLEG